MSLAAAIVFLSLGSQDRVHAAGLPNLPVQALAVDPTNSQIVYAGTTNGIYKTVDGGANWTRVDSGLVYTDVLALAVHPTAPCTIYAGIDSHVVNIVFPGQIIVQNTSGILAVSFDCGAHWAVATAGLSGAATRSLAFTNANPAALYASITVNTVSGGFSAAMHRLARVLPGTTDFSFAFEDFNYVVATAPSGPCIAYAGALSGTVKRNTNCTGPMNWTAVGTPLTILGKPTQVNTVAVHPANQNLVLAGTGAGGIFRKNDDVSPWMLVTTIAGSVNSIVYEPGNPQVAYAAGSGGVVYRTIDGASTWSALSTIGSAVSRLAASGTPSLRVFAAGNSFVVNVGPSAPSPIVTTLSATNVTNTSATLNATVNPNGSSTTAQFEWGTTTSYGNQAPASPVPGSGNAPVAVSAPITGLTCNTLYHFRATANSAAGPAVGTDATFVTPPVGCGFTDEPLISGVTPIKAVHITELRVRIDFLRVRYGLAAFTWTDPVLVAGASIRAQHLIDLRTALAAAYLGANRPAPTYSDSGIGAGTTARTAHIAEVRAAIIALE